MADPFERYGLERIVGVSGTETVRGAAPVAPEVIAAVSGLVPHLVEMAELQSVASEVIAEAYGTEAGCVTGCSAAGIAVAIAACMTGRDLARVEQLPDTTGMKHEVVLQRGHDVTWGGHVLQTIEITGAKAVEVGAATECGSYQIRHALGPETAAALYVVSHHTVQTGLLDLETFCRICHEAGVPVIVDGAAEPNFRDFVAAGADLLITSAHKVFAALTAGVIAGRKELIQACIWQEKGIGRPMKVGKEGVIGAIAGIERWLALDHERLARELDARLERARDRLQGLEGVTVSLEDDWTSRAFRRVRLDIDRARAGMSAYQLARRLAAGRPAITVRGLYADQGFLQLDLRRADDATVDLVCERIVGALQQGAAEGPARPPSPSDAALAALERWPMPVRPQRRV
jgi:uncharacterized pyridoxal phosphate-dependent enzyme